MQELSVGAGRGQEGPTWPVSIRWWDETDDEYKTTSWACLGDQQKYPSVTQTSPEGLLVREGEFVMWKRLITECGKSILKKDK